MAKNPLHFDDEPFDTHGEGPSFADILSEYEQGKRQPRDQGNEGRDGVVVAVSPESVFVDVGFKIEGVIEAAVFAGVPPKPGDHLKVTITGRNPEGYYTLSMIKVARPKDFTALEKAFQEKSTVGGVVTGLVKGGLTVDIGVRAFLPASRSGTKDAAELEKLVGQEISCKIIQLDVAEEDAVVDRRVVVEEEEKQAKERMLAELKEGTVLHGTVRTLADYGAFIDIGGVDGLLHVADMSWGRVNKPSDVLSVGDNVDVQVLKVDAAKRRISLGMKQLAPDPWSNAGEKYKTGERVHGTVTRVTDFGAFVELEPGLEGLIHLSEMSWTKKVRKPSDVVKPGDSVEVVVLGVSEHRISLGLKQALGDPWAEIEKRFPAGSVVEGAITTLTKFGAFVELGEGIEGMIHVGDISADKRINHPQELLKTGQAVRAAVLDVDREKRRIRLGMKQLQPTSIDEYIAEHKEGDLVTGRIADVSGGKAKVELGEGVRATCAAKAEGGAGNEGAGGAADKADLSSLTSMLASKWKKGGGAGAPEKREPARAGQIRSFRIVHLDPEQKRIELELAG
jgi:small subunit ribosomal protein S1